MSTIIRPAVKEDLEVVAALEAASFDDSYPRFVIRQFLDLSPELLLVAVAEDEVVGYTLGVAGRGGIGWALSLAIAEKARGRGLAGRLLDALIENCESASIERLRATVAPGNRPSRGLLESRGFVVVGGETDWFGPGMERLLMERELTLK